MITFNANLMGKMVIVQDENEFEIQIRQGNCLAVFIHLNDDRATLYNFYADEQHLKNIIKGCKEDGTRLFWDDVKSIRLNMRYKECAKLVKYFTQSGYEVNCYWE